MGCPCIRSQVTSLLSRRSSTIAAVSVFCWLTLSFAETGPWVASYIRKCNAKSATNTERLMPLFRTQPWLFTIFVPWKEQDSDFLALSVSPNTVHTSGIFANTKGFTETNWLDIWKSGKSNIAQLPLSNFDFTRVLPYPVSATEDLYLFYFMNAGEIRSSDPVARRTPAGWAWQTLNSVEWSVRKQVRMADFAHCKVIDATGSILADIAFIKELIPNTQKIVDLGCKASVDEVIGLAGSIAPAIANVDAGRKGRAPAILELPLPYSNIYRYISSPHGAPKVLRLPTVMVPASLSPTTVNSVPGTALSPPINSLYQVAAEIAPNDHIYFGRPVVDFEHSEKVLYWYCVQSAKNPKHRVFILACFDGITTYPVDGYVQEGSIVSKSWSGHDWVESGINLYWDYETILRVPVQPIVGLDAHGTVIVYRPPDIMRVVD